MQERTLQSAPLGDLMLAAPQGLPLLGHMQVFRGARHDKLLQIQRQYGDFVRLRVGGKTLYLVSDPDLIKYIVQETHANQMKAGGLAKLKSFLGNGLLLSNGEHWLRNRRLVQPAFGPRALQAASQTMADCTRRWVERWERLAVAQTVVDVHREMLELSLEIATQTLFSTSFDAHDVATFERCLPFMMRVVARRMYMIVDVPEWFPTPRNLRFRRCARALDAIVYRIIDARRRSGEKRDDLLGLLLASADDQGGGGQLDNRQLRDEVMTLLTAGHETTALLISWTLYMLSRHPEVWERLHAELTTPPTLTASHPEQLATLPYLRSVLQETLRLYPPAWVIRRQLIHGDRIGNQHLPGGTDFLFSSYVVHRHPQYWPNPEAFDPNRFSPDITASRPRYAYFPFGGGPRVCIGQHFGLMEAAIVVGMVASRFRLNLVEGCEVLPESSFTLRPDRPLQMRISPQSASASGG
jgi:cytochrome P450